MRCVIRIKITLRLPEGLAEDRKTRSTRLRVFPIVSFITIDANSPLIKIRTLLKNTVKDHRLRVLFPTEINTGKSYAETQFDVVEHEIHPDHYDDNQIPDDLKRVLLGAREPEPITSFPQQSFVDLTDGRRGFALLNRGLPEYEIIGNNNTIALTLFRSIGWLARGDLLTRTGDAGPTIYTPEAQCLREMEFNYALYFHKGDWREGKVHQYSEQFNSECLVVRSDSHPGELPAKQGFLKLESTGDALKLTALKRSEDGEGIILRCYNPSDYEIEGVLTSVFEITSAIYVDLKETLKEQITNTLGGKIVFIAGPRKIVTLKIVLQRKRQIEKSPTHPQHHILWPEMLQPGEDFSAYPSMPVVTCVDIAREEQRAREIADQLENATQRVVAIEKDLKEKQNPAQARFEAELQLARGDVATFERSLLEAQLSVILSKKKFNELNQKSEVFPLNVDEIRSKCRGIGVRLNMARIRKRIYDYITEYYNQ
ncbi:MAG: hypothetical protein FVQ80_17975 [Planctomycetes bacterium]|nr:hypothetical protein [Planctomycetota bacterium]